MFREATGEEKGILIEKAEEEIVRKGYKYGYIYLVSLESIENSSALAALTFVDITC